MVGDGGGRQNFSPSVCLVAATAAQSIYYFPRSDLASTVIASRALDAGSARGYGTLQSMGATEMLVDEVAAELGRRSDRAASAQRVQDRHEEYAGRDPGRRDARRRSAGQGARASAVARSRQAQEGVRGRASRASATASASAACRRTSAPAPRPRSSKSRCRRKAASCCAIARSRWAPAWPPARRRCARSGSAVPPTTCAPARPTGPTLPMFATDDPWLMQQAVQDSQHGNPRWTPNYMSPSSASNSAYFCGHATREAARLLFAEGLWPAARAIWSAGFGGGQLAPLSVRAEDARWVEGRLTAGGLAPLTLAAARGEGARARPGHRRSGAHLQSLAMGRSGIPARRRHATPAARWPGAALRRRHRSGRRPGDRERLPHRRTQPRALPAGATQQRRRRLLRDDGNDRRSRGRYRERPRRPAQPPFDPGMRQPDRAGTGLRPAAGRPRDGHRPCAARIPAAVRGRARQRHLELQPLHAAARARRRGLEADRRSAAGAVRDRSAQGHGRSGDDRGGAGDRERHRPRHRPALPRIAGDAGEGTCRIGCSRVEPEDIAKEQLA